MAIRNLDALSNVTCARVYPTRSPWRSFKWLLGSVLLTTACGSTETKGFDASVRCATSPCVTRISLGYDHGCAVLSDQTVACWGNNDVGQLGIEPDGSSLAVWQPTLVAGLTKVVEIGAGAQFSCALTESHEAYCWGSNEAGMLGLGTAADADVHARPQLVPAFGSVSELSVGARFVLARTDDGSVYGWGDGVDGELANKSVIGGYLSTPTRIVGIDKVSALAAGERVACAIAGQSQALCWGRTGDPITATGEPGTALMSVDGVVRVVPTNVPNLGAAHGVAAGARAAVAVADNGSVYGWGVSRAGLLEFPQGNPGSWFSARPIGTASYEFSGKVVELTLGDNHGCALDDSGLVQCWGDNEFGQAGLGTITSEWPQPIQTVPVLTDIVQIDAGGNATCAVRRDGVVYCWGANPYGQLGQDNGGDIKAVQASPGLVLW